KEAPNNPKKKVQIVESVRKGSKVSQKIVRHVGVAIDDDELEKLKLLAESIKQKLEDNGQLNIFAPEEFSKMDNVAKHIQITEEDYQVDIRDLEEESRLTKGIHDIYGNLFEQLGFRNVIQNPARNKSSVNIFKEIVLARIANPISKNASVDMLEKDFGISLNLDRVYKMMDKLNDVSIERVNDIAYNNTLELFNNKIDVIFYDCTTIYFESFKEDYLKEPGYSKDHKFGQPQVLMALMVTKEGLPIGYQIFNGSKWEGDTLAPALKELRTKYNLDNIIFVADAGMLSKDNLNKLEELEQEGFEYIVGARIKNLPKVLTEQVLDYNNYNGDEEYKIGKFDYNGRNLIISYSKKRAKKDYHDRLKSVDKLKSKLSKNQKPKEHLKNQPFKKYLKLEGEASISLDNERIEADARWDGLHGVISNCKELTNEEILAKYTDLWQVENAFRVTKHDLKIRPVFHWKPERVKAHFVISFVAYSLVKYLEYRVGLQYVKMSPEKIRQTLIRVQTSIHYNKEKNIRYALPSKIPQEAKKIYKILEIPLNTTPYILEKCSAL
ncbi:MAG: IS1634 family transposase, partial [Nanoarchaeota archaeon]